MRYLMLLFATGVLLSGTQASQEAPVRVFAALDGTWSGTFVGYDPAGRELYRISVRQTYRTIDETRQTVRLEDTMADGTVITGHGHNLAERSADGSLTLRCIVEKSNGDRVEHAGRLAKGPEGDEQIVWYTNKPGRVETFRELVRREGDRTVYEINGMGKYGKTLVLMTGRYWKE